MVLTRRTLSAQCGRFALLTLVAGALLAPHAGLAQDTITLARTFKKGEVVKAKVEVKASLAGQEVLVTSDSTETVKDVLPNGNVILESKDENTKITLGGMEMEQPAPPPATTTRTKYGKLIDYKRAQEAEGIVSPDVQKVMMSISEVIFPEKAVKNGDSWSTELENAVIKEQKLTVKTTFLGTEKVGDTTYWKVQQLGEGIVDGNGLKMKSDITYWLDPKDGSTFKQEGKLSDIPTQFGPISWTIKFTRVP